MQTIEIYDIYGRHQVAETPRHQGDLTVDVSDLNSGVYFVKIVTDKGEVTKLFIKK
ncbi:MAG: T9SS type A sorting domain-containing protein [Bacteroidales bacterium]|nr:T9SS type A sorting domain-containing protein [Bacteroidales bacterium]